MKIKRSNLIGLIHIDDLGTREIGEWLRETSIPRKLRTAVINAFDEYKSLTKANFYMGTMMIKPSTREARFVPYWPKGEYLQDCETESNLTRFIQVVVKDFDQLKARASLLGINLEDLE